jgi:hypothetical protein
MISNSESSQSSSNSNVPSGIHVGGGPIRLNNIKGYTNRQNNIIYCPPLLRCTNNNQDEPEHAVVYFGGDVQDIPEMMEENRDTKGYIKFNLDNTAVLLRETFPRAHIIVIRPVRFVCPSTLLFFYYVTLVGALFSSEWSSQHSAALITL